MAQIVDVYTIQELMSKHEQPIYGRSTYVPTTVIVPIPVLDTDVFKLRKFGRTRILSDSKSYKELFGYPDQVFYWNDPDITPFSYQLPPEIVRKYYLKEGELLTLQAQSDVVEIAEINHHPSSERENRVLPDLQYLIPDPPTVPLPLELYGDIDVRIITLLAPIGQGESRWHVGEGTTGKTSNILKEMEAAIWLMDKLEEVFILASFVADRPMDFARYMRVLSKAKDRKRVRAFSSPWTDSPTSQVETLEFAANMSRLLCALGYSVIWFIESISKIAKTHTGSTLVDKTTPIMPGGMFYQSMQDIIAGLLGTVGNYKKYDLGSITIIGSVMSGDARTMEAVIDREASDNATTSVVRYDKNMPSYPKIVADPRQTYTRFPAGYDIRTPIQKGEMDEIEHLLLGDLGMGDKTDSVMQYMLLDQYAREHPIPPYIHELERMLEVHF